MKPGTKSRKLGLQIPTVNPCNDFIIDYLIRNKIKSDKQVLCKSYLYNLAIEAVRKYPLPLVCEEQLAALQGFGNFFIGQVGRLIKRHYTRGRMPTQKQMEEDDQAHFQALRGQKKLTDQRPVKGGFREDLQDSPIFRSSSKNYDDKKKDYRPKRRTEPMNILESMHLLNAHQRAVTKGEINQVLFNQSKQKIRLWYVLKQKLQEYDFIQVDAKDSQFIYLTQKGKKYVQEYDKQQKQQKGRKKKKQQQEDDQQDQEFKDRIQSSSKFSRKNQSNLQSQQNKSIQNKEKVKGKVIENRINKLVAEMQLKKIILSKLTKYQSVDLLINLKDGDISQKQSIIQKFQDLNYQFCNIELADFLWTVTQQVKLLDCMAIRIKQNQFQEEQFKTICFRAKVTSCDNIYLIIQRSGQNFTKKQEGSDQNPLNQDQKNRLLEIQRQNRSYLLACARVAGFKVIQTQDLKQTMQFVRQLTNLLFKNLQSIQSFERSKKGKKDRSFQTQQLKHMGSLERFNQKVGLPYEMSTITKECLKCIPDLTIKCVNILQQKLPTLYVMHNKIQDNGTTKQKKLFLRSYLINEKVSDNSINTLVQLLFYEAY